MRIVNLHYTAPPVIGGVEAVIRAHTRCLLEAGHTVAVIAGEGAQKGLAQGADFVGIPELASQHPAVGAVSAELEQGRVPAIFEALTTELAERLRPLLKPADWVVVHNVFTKHFNLPLTAALHRLLDQGGMGRCIAWCHDFSWTSSHSRSKLHAGYPWDLLKTYRSDVAYVTVSQRRQRELAGLLHCPVDRIRVIYNGVDPGELLGLSAEGQSLADGFDLGESDLVLLMPVRVTQAKNIEYALRVVEALKGRGLRPRLIVTGPPDPHDAQNLAYYHSLLDLRRQLGIEHEVRFVCEAGPRPDQLRLVDTRVVGDLFRVSDVLFMPSHREGFGMPVVEAGLAGLAVFCAAVPAAEELGGEDVTLFSADDAPVAVAARLAGWAESNAIHRWRRRVRQTLTWDRLFQSEVLPWLEGRAT